MKRYFNVSMFVTAFVVLPQLSLAQSMSLDGDVDSELTQMYSNSATRRASNNVVSQQTPSPQVPPTAIGSGSQPIYILNQAPTSNANANAQVQSSQVQKQPVTVIQDTPLEESKADRIRRARQGIEVQTELKVVEKLEQMRMEDEKRRLQQLFNETQVQQPLMPVQQPVAPIQQPVQQAPVVVAPVSQVQPSQAPAAVPVVVVAPTQESRKNQNELAKAVVAEEIIEDFGRRYMGGLLGIGEYPDAANVRGNYVLGVSYGKRYDYYAVEGSFLASNYNVAQIYVDPMWGQMMAVPVDVNQYSAAFAMKYFLSSGSIRPVLGGVGMYSYRTYSMGTFGSGCGTCGGSQANSHALDVGPVAGVDFEVNRKMSVGIDFRYMFNVAGRINFGGPGMGPYGPTPVGFPLEKMQYYILALTGTFTF